MAFLVFLFEVSLDGKTSFLLATMLGVLLRVPYVGLVFAVNLTGCFWVDWNHAQLTACTASYHTHMFLLAPPNPPVRHPIIQFVHGTQTTIVFGLLMFIFILHIRESDRRAAAQKAANEMTLKVLRKQRKYDTSAIGDILEQCKEAAIVDDELISLFGEMNATLESYRPFLPNYLFQQDEGEDADNSVRSSVLSYGDVEEFLASAIHSRRGSVSSAEGRDNPLEVRSVGSQSFHQLANSGVFSRSTRSTTASSKEQHCFSSSRISFARACRHRDQSRHANLQLCS